MDTDLSTQWPKSETDCNKCNLYSVTFSKILFILCHLMFQSTGCWNDNPFPLHYNSLQIGSCCPLYLVSPKKSSCWAGWVKQSWFWLVFGRYLVWILSWTTIALTEDVGGYLHSFQAKFLIVPEVRPWLLSSSSYFCSLFPFHPVIGCCRLWFADSVIE